MCLSISHSFQLGFFLNVKQQGWRDSTVGMALTLHMSDLVLSPASHMIVLALIGVVHQCRARPSDRAPKWKELNIWLNFLKIPNSWQCIFLVNGRNLSWQHFRFKRSLKRPVGTQDNTHHHKELALQLFPYAPRQSTLPSIIFLLSTLKSTVSKIKDILLYFCVSPFAPPFCLFKLHGVSKFSNNTLTKFQGAPESQEPLVPKDRRLENILLSLTTSDMLWQMRSGEVESEWEVGPELFGGGGLWIEKIRNYLFPAIK